MSIENELRIPEAEQVKTPSPSREGLTPDEQQKLDRFNRALSLGSGLIKKWLKDKKGVEFTAEQEDEFDKVYQASFAFSSLAM